MNFIKRYWRIIFPIFFILLIWHFSEQSGTVSDGASTGWANFLGLPNSITRKLAHMALFAGLGYSVCSFFKGLYPTKFPTIITISYSIIFCLCYGALDEVHQLMVPGRSGEVRDIIIDTLGGIIGTCIYIAIFCFWRQFRIQRKLKALK